MAKKQYAYKIFKRNDLGELSSYASLLPRQYRIKYPVNTVTRPEDKKSGLFVFKKYDDVLGFLEKEHENVNSRGIEVWLVEVGKMKEAPERILSPASTSFDEVGKFWGSFKQKIPKYYGRTTPAGTCLTSSVKPIKRVKDFYCDIIL